MNLTMTIYIIQVLGDRKFPVSELHLYASARSAGKAVSAAENHQG